MKVKKGMYWHCHHDVLLEFCYDEDGRRAFIENNKPESEKKLRQRLFKRVKGKLPEKVVKAWKAYVKARDAYAKACKAYGKAYEAYAKAYEDHKEEIEKLHTKECPDCPWSSEKQTIFPTGKDK